jgi:hypothetical protein
MGISNSLAQRQKLSRAAKTVNRECGTESVIGGGSGELLNHTINIPKKFISG